MKSQLLISNKVGHGRIIELIRNDGPLELIGELWNEGVEKDGKGEIISLLFNCITTFIMLINNKFVRFYF